MFTNKDEKATEDINQKLEDIQGELSSIKKTLAEVVKMMLEMQKDDDEIYSSLPKPEESGENDSLYEDARNLAVRTQKASTSYFQRKLGIGYGRAAALIDALEENEIIGPQSGTKKREVYKKPEDDE